MGGGIGKGGAGKSWRGDGDGAGFGPGLQIGGALDFERARVGKEFKGEVPVGQLPGGIAGLARA